MPYNDISEYPPALKGIKPALTVDQANAIADQAEAIGTDEKKNGWAIAISQFKKTHTVRNRRWVERKNMTKENETGGEKTVSESMSWVPCEITSFAQLRAHEQAEKLSDDVRSMTGAFTEMLWNIVSGLEENKLEAMRVLSDEYMIEIEKIIGQSQPMEGGDPVSTQEDGSITLAESFESVVVLQEDGEKPDITYLDVQVIRPGWGNQRDNHYYPAEMLRRDAGQFVGAKMYETDHRDDEKSTRTWVSTVKEITGFTDDGAPIARVAVHDPDFASRVRNLNSAGLLDKMECSILAYGTAKKFEKEGRKGSVVESLTGVSSVDWVTRAGAGGKVLNISESEPEAENIETTAADEQPADVTEAQDTAPIEIRETEPVLEQDKVKTMLLASRLPVQAQERLGETAYRDIEQLQAAIASEKEYIKSITGSGEPFGLSESETPTPKPVDMSEIEKRKDAINKKHLHIGDKNA